MEEDKTRRSGRGLAILAAYTLAAVLAAAIVTGRAGTMTLVLLGAGLASAVGVVYASGRGRGPSL